jgi:hypothetical protein
MDIVDALVGKAARELMTDCDVNNLSELMYRQRRCQIQYSIDGGFTWYVMYDFNKCKTPATVQTEMIAATESLDTIEETYDDDILNVAPLFEKEVGNDDYIDTVLCKMLHDWVEVNCVSLANQIDDKNERIDDIRSIYLKINAAVIDIEEELAGWLFPELEILYDLAAEVGNELASWYTAQIAGWFTDDSVPYRDLNAREEVQCAMYSALKDTTIEFGVWSASLTSVSLTGNAETIREMIDDCNQSERAFVAWFAMYNALVAAVKKGAVIDQCPCVSPCGFDLTWIEIDATPTGWGLYDGNLHISPVAIPTASREPFGNWWSAEGFDDTPKMDIELMYVFPEPVTLKQLFGKFHFFQQHSYFTQLQIKVGDVWEKVAEHNGGYPNSGVWDLWYSEKRSGVQAVAWMVNGGHNLSISDTAVACDNE